MLLVMRPSIASTYKISDMARKRENSKKCLQNANSRLKVLAIQWRPIGVSDLEEGIVRKKLH